MGLQYGDGRETIWGRERLKGTLFKHIWKYTGVLFVRRKRKGPSKRGQKEETIVIKASEINLHRRDTHENSIMGFIIFNSNLKSTVTTKTKSHKKYVDSLTKPQGDVASSTS